VRKLPLVIHVEPLNPVALNKSCRYSPGLYGVALLELLGFLLVPLGQPQEGQT